PGINQLLDRRTLVRNGTTLCIPRFMEAQECRTSDAQRKRESRARRRLQALSQNVTDSHTRSQQVTASHSESQHVTPSLAEPNRSEPVTSGHTESHEVTKRDITSRDPR